MIKRLRELRKVIEGGFTNKGLATNAKGDFVSPFDDEAVNYSFVGALNKIFGGRADTGYNVCLNLIRETLILNRERIPQDQIGALRVIGQTITRLEGELVLLEKRYKSFVGILDSAREVQSEAARGKCYGLSRSMGREIKFYEDEISQLREELGYVQKKEN